MPTMTKAVTIKVRNVGQNFGCEGVLVYRNGRVAATTDTLPYGMRGVAHERAVALAAKLGLSVVERS